MSDQLTEKSYEPYRGLNPYSEDDAPFFFGREKLQRNIIANLKSSRLTLLYGASGVGKSSVLQAGVTYNLRKLAKQRLKDYGAPKFAVVIFRTWNENPLTELIKQIETDIKELYKGVEDKILKPSSHSIHLDQTLQAWTELIGKKDEKGQLVTRGKLLIILDQFEEYFSYHPNETGEGTFALEFPRAVNRPDLSVNFLISIREDNLAQLDFFDKKIPSLFDNYLRIRHLDAKSGYEAIVKPINKYNELVSIEQPIGIEADLAKVVIDQVSQFIIGRNGLGGIEKLRPQLEKQIETPYLQLVMNRLWEEEMNANSRCLYLQTLLGIGGSEKIVEDHLNNAMESLRKKKGETAVKTIAKTFQYLVTPSGNKIAYPVSDLAKHTRLDKTQLKGFLDELVGEKHRILRRVELSGDRLNMERYEIFHDVLGQPILKWRSKYFLDEEIYKRNLAIKEGLPAQSLRQGKLGQDEKAALLARQAYRFYQREPKKVKVLYQIDDALREALCIPYFSNILQGPEKELYGFSAVAFNPKNRQMLASADGNGIVRLWDLRRSPDARRSLTLEHDHVAGVNALAFSPDGKMLASGGSDGIVGLWNLDKPDLPCRILGHKIVGRHAQSVTSVAFNYDKTILASGSKDGNIQLWNPNNQSENKPLTKQPLRDAHTVVRAVAFSPIAVDFSPDKSTDKKKGYLLASGSEDHQVRLWHISQLLETHNFKPLGGHRGIVRSVAFRPDGQMLASGSDDKTVRLWNVGDLEHLNIEPKILNSHKDHVWSVAFSPDGQMLASGCEDQTVYLWELNQLDQQLTLLNLGHDFGISAVAFSPDNKILASGSWDKTIRLWHLAESEAKPQNLREHKDNIMSVAVSPNGRWLASGGWDKTVRLWDLSEPQPEPQILKGNEHNDKVFGVAFDHNSQMLASAGADHKIKLWNLKNLKEEPQELKDHKDGVSSVAFSPDGRWLVSGSWKKDATVRLWDLEHPDSTGRIIGKILWQHKNFKTDKGESVTSVAFSLDGQMIASGSDDATIKLLDVRRTDELSWDSIYEKSSSNSPENPVVYPLVLTGHDARVWSVAFSPNSQMLASGSDDRTIRLWDISKGEGEPQDIPVAEKEHNFWVGSVAFSPDGHKLASGSYDKNIRIWDLNHLDEDPIVLRGHEQSVTSVAFYPDSKKLVSGSYDNTVVSWIVDTKILADLVCEKVQRNLSQKEWEWFMRDDIPYELTCPNLPPGEGTSEVVRAEEVSELEREFRVKLAQLFAGQKYVLEFIERRITQQSDVSEEDVTNFLHKPKGDPGTFYRLETLRLLGFLEITSKSDKPGTKRYALSPRYREYLNIIKARPTE